MRIVFWVRAGNKYGSVEKYIALFAEHCQKRGHPFLLLNEIENTNLEYLSRLASAGSEQIVIGEIATDRIKVFSRVDYIVRSWKPDIVQTHLATTSSIPYFKLRGIPCIYPTYNNGLLFPVSIKTILAACIVSRLATRVVCISERIRRDVTRIGIQPQKIITIYRGLPIKEYLTSADKITEPIPIGYYQPGIRKIITVGRFFPEKGMRYVVEAAVDVLREYPNVIWWLVGKEGPESDYCRQLVCKNTLEERIIFLGQRNDVPALLAKAWVQVVGSLSEGLPQMALESSVFGVPTIGTQIGGLDEAVIDGTTGILVESRSSGALAHATKYILQNPGIREIYGKAAKKYIADRFDSEKLIPSLLNIFESDYLSMRKH